MKSPDQNAGRGRGRRGRGRGRGREPRQDRCQSLRQAGVQIKLPLSQVLKIQSAMVGDENLDDILIWGSSIYCDKDLYIYTVHIYRMPMMLGF